MKRLGKKHRAAVISAALNNIQEFCIDRDGAWSDRSRAEAIMAWAIESACADCVEALKRTRHDVDCHPSEGRHSQECRARRRAIRDLES